MTPAHARDVFAKRLRRQWTGMRCRMTSTTAKGAILRSAYVRRNKRLMQTATRTGPLFMLESFCGHGFYADDPDNACHRGVDAEVWFEQSLHPPQPDRSCTDCPDVHGRGGRVGLDYQLPMLASIHASRCGSHARTRAYSSS